MHMPMQKETDDCHTGVLMHLHGSRQTRCLVCLQVSEVNGGQAQQHPKALYAHRWTVLAHTLQGKAANGG